MSKRIVQVNDVVVFNPDSFESSRVDPELRNWIFCDGLKPWRGAQVPFISIAGFTRVPLGLELDVLAPGVGGWRATDIHWANVPCDAASCMLVVEREGAYVKLLPLNDDYKPPMPIEKLWVSASVLEHGAEVGILQVLP